VSITQELEDLYIQYWGSVRSATHNKTLSLQIKRNIAKDTNEYKKIVRQGTQEINNPKYQGMLVDVLEQLKIDEHHHTFLLIDSIV
jgi:hypothetical protein